LELVEILLWNNKKSGWIIDWMIQKQNVSLWSESGGQLEADAAHWIKADGNRKPVVGFIAGVTARQDVRMGHAGAIVGGSDDTAEAKQIMRNAEFTW
jgi:succinyl-CoA synthetase alpha subunit